MHLEDIEGKQELAAISMDNYRNKILNLNLSLGIAEVSLALGTFFTGIFGMNLTSGLESAHSSSTAWRRWRREGGNR